MSTPGESIFGILKRPLITEKTAVSSSFSNAVVFEVHKQASKSEIKRAVEKIFEVKVKKVRTTNAMGKLKRLRGRIGRQPSWKKAYVMLQPGEKIDLMEGL